MLHKIIRDPIYDYISFEGEDHRWLFDLLNTPEVQRLRHIHQLGVSHFVYPGASHTRLSHTLGVFHLMKEAVRHLEFHFGESIERQDSEALLAVAILHDVGHGPFSHLLEKRLGVRDDVEGNHEEWSCRIIEDDSTDVHRILADHDLVDDVVRLLREDKSAKMLWLKHLISSQLDVDRMDYLLRDSFFTGIGYGRFDYYRLIHTMELHEVDRPEGGARTQKRLVWPERSKYVIEQYIFARYYMYRSVYLHNTTRGYEKLLEAIWDRASQVHKDGTQLGLCAALTPFFSEGERSTADFLRLGEFHILSQIEEWANDISTEPVLCDLCERFIKRRGFKTINLMASLEGREALRIQEAEEYIKSIGGPLEVAPEKYLLEDKAGVTIYKPFGWGSEDDVILVRGDSGSTRNISELLPRLSSVLQRETFLRYYCPAEHKDEVQKILNG